MSEPNTADLEALALPLVAAAEKVGVGVMVLAVHSSAVHLVFVSSSLAARLGYSPADLLTMDPNRLLADGRRWGGGDVEPSGFEVRSEHGGEAPDVVLLHRLGRRLPLAVSWGAMDLEGQQYWVASWVDHSAEKRARQELQRSRERLRLLLEVVPEAIWIQTQSRIVYANGSCLHLLGYDRDTDLIGTDPRRILHPDDVELFDRRTRTLLDSEPAVPPCEYRVYRRDGEQRILEVASLGGQYAGERVVYHFGRDATERRHAEAKLLQTDRLGVLGLLAGGMAHAINNPLTYVLLNLAHIEQNLPNLTRDPHLLDDALMRLREAESGARRIGDVVKQMRTLSRANDHTVGPVDLEQVLSSVLGMVGNEIRHRGRLVTSLTRVRPVVANAARIEQVFLNLLVYVTRALPEGEPTAEIRLVLAEESPERVVVELSGTTRTEAMPGDEASRGFRPGLGLSLCQSVVASLGGRLQIESEPEGGIRFRVELPGAARVLEEPPSIPQSESEPVESVRRARVMVVDDDPAVARALRLMLQEDHDVTSVAGGGEALRLLLKDGDYDIVFCDVMMPEVSGIDLYEGLRLNRPGLERVLCFMTGGAFTPEAFAFLDRVTNPTIEKPFNLASLSRLLRGAGRRRPSRG